jgi:general secretion pathway protein K
MKQEQQGMALLVVLMILAIMAALATEMTLRFQVNLKRTGYTASRLAQNQLVGIAEQQAGRILQQDLKDNAKYTSPDQYWAQPHEIELNDDRRLHWHLEDGQNCFNLNVLAAVPVDALDDEPYSVKTFRALLDNSGADGARADTVIDSIADFIDSDELPRRAGAESEYYRTRDIPRDNANTLFVSVSELISIQGMTAELYQRLAPNLCALPNTELQINVSTLTPRHASLLAAIFNNVLSVKDVETLFANRSTQTWQNPVQLTGYLEKTFPGHDNDFAAAKGILTTFSHFFRLETEVQQDDGRQYFTSQLEYDEKEKKVVIVARRAGVYEHIKGSR